MSALSITVNAAIFGFLVLGAFVSIRESILSDLLGDCSPGQNEFILLK